MQLWAALGALSKHLSDLNKVAPMASVDPIIPANSSAGNYSFSVSRKFYPKPGSELEKTLKETNGSKGKKRNASSPLSSQSVQRKTSDDNKKQTDIREAILNSRRGITVEEAADADEFDDDSNMMGFDDLGEPGKKD